MADVHADVNRADLMEAWAEPSESLLGALQVSEERSRRAVLAFGRFSVWVTGRGLGAGDLDTDLIDQCVRAEQQRSGSRVPAAAQYLPLLKRFPAAQDVLVTRAGESLS